MRIRSSRLLLVAAVLTICNNALQASCYKCEHRSSAARREFKHLHPCPANGNVSGRCPGYTIDHINPLDCGGADAPKNMQWQTRKAAKAKDRWERIGCKDGHR